MKRYPSNRDSGIEWLGDIPQHWGLKRLKWVLTEPLKYGANEVAEFEDHAEPRYIRITDFGDDGKLRDDTFKSLSLKIAEDYFLKEGDVLFARSGATVGKTFQFKNYSGKACFAGYLIKASPNENEVLSDFLYAFTKSNAYDNWKNSIFSQATIQNIGADKFEVLPVTVPPLPEQQAIAAYLDGKTHKIELLIEKKKRFIELLKEQRTAIINQAVTRGIDPNVKLKDSGIEWIGEIPERWSVVGLTKYLHSIVDYRGKTPEKADEGVFLVTARNIKNGRIDYSLSTEFISPDHYETVMGRGLPRIGDVLFTTEAPLGEVANVDIEKVALAQRVIKFRAKAENLDNYFLKYWIMSKTFQGDLQSFATGSTALGIKASKLNLLRLVLPPLQEQRDIVEYLDRSLAVIDSSSLRAEKVTTLLREYRAALISEVVTGKIDVRDFETGKSN